MRFGVCCSLDKAPAALRAGADYVELPAWPLASDAEYAQALRDLPVEATNLFFPSGMRLSDDLEACLRHGRIVVARAEELGIDVCVVGSGAARRSLEGNEIDGLQTFVDAVGAIAQASAKDRLAPESLNRDETNVGVDLRDLAERLKAVGVGYTADSYHVLREWRSGGEAVPFDTLWETQIPYAPAHVHLGNVDRYPPSLGEPSHPTFFNRLKALGYDARMSLECRWEDFDSELGPALTTLRQMWSEATA